MSLGEEIEGAQGTSWTADEIDVLVESYFRMLTEELADRPYNKSEYRRQVKSAVRRSEGSVERKLQNVSAVLDEIGLPWINGYKPLAHYQDALIAAIDRQLSRHANLLKAAPVGQQRPRDETSILVPPPTVIGRDPEERSAVIRQLIQKFDPAARDAPQPGSWPRWRGIRSRFRAAAPSVGRQIGSGAGGTLGL